MTTSLKPVMLEQFAQSCTEAAREASGKRDLGWSIDDKGFARFHCPLTNGGHAWNGAPRAWAIATAEGIVAHCDKCIGPKADHTDQAALAEARSAYADQLKRLVRWEEEDGVVKVDFEHEVVRSHVYLDRDFKNAVRRDKIRFKDGRKERGNSDPWWWYSAPLGDDLKPGRFHYMRADPWLTQHYPEVPKLVEALCWYGFEMWVDWTAVDATAYTAATVKLTAYRVAICEGEKDADTFNALMKCIRSDWVGTCLTHPNPKLLAAHQLRAVEGRDVVIIGDADEPGRHHAEAWTRRLWGRAASIRLVRDELGLDGAQDSKDLSDWVEARGGVSAATAEQLLAIMTAVPPLTEPLGTSDDWRVGMRLNQRGVPRMDSPYNAKRVWTMHPALRGRPRTNLHSGEVEVVEPPWGGEITVGVRTAAGECAAWLDEVEEVSLSAKVLEDMLRSPSVAPHVNTMPQPGEWDGGPALSRLPGRLPLDVAPEQAAVLWQLFFSDLERKLAGEHHAQRMLLGLVTDRVIDVAGAMLGDRGAVHTGVVTEAHLFDYARRGTVLVQVDVTAVGDQRRALRSVAQLFLPSVWHRGAARMIPTPMFLACGAWGPDSRTAAKVDGRCLLLDLGVPVLEALGSDVMAALAEARARMAEFRTTPVPDQKVLMTVDEAERKRSVHRMLEAILLYATRAISTTRPMDLADIENAGFRSEPRRHVVRSQLFLAMHHYLYDQWRTPAERVAIFNRTCGVLGRDTKLTLTVNTADLIDFRHDFGGSRSRRVPGILLDDDDLSRLRALVAEEEAEKGDCVPLYPERVPQENVNEPAVCTRVMESCFTYEESYATEGEGTSTTKSIIDSLARAPAQETRIYDRASKWIEGTEAVEAVRSILATPGECAIDFETWPPAPAWVGDQAAEAAKRGHKGDARAKAVQRAVEGGRAHARQACTLQVAHGDGREVFVRLTDPVAELPEMFAPMVGREPWDDDLVLVAHNAQFEAEVLAQHGVHVDVECTMLAAKALHLVAVPKGSPQPVEYSLAALVRRELGRERDKTIRDRDWREVESLDDEAVEYGLQDVRDCLDLWRCYRPRLQHEGLLTGYRDLQRAVLPTAASLNMRGMLLDAGAHARLIQRMAADRDDLTARLDVLCGHAIPSDKDGKTGHGSTQKISRWIVGQVMGTPWHDGDDPELMTRFNMRLHARTGGVLKSWRCTKTGHLSITKGVKIRRAEQLAEAFPSVADYLIAHERWQKHSKLIDAFGPALRRWRDPDDRIRGQFKVWGTVTGRHSCVNPNLTQQPHDEDFRALWVASPGRKFIIADYSQIELRIAAIQTLDERLLDVYREGRDVHVETGMAAWGLKVLTPEQRRAAKPINFGIIYGSGSAGLAEAGGFSLTEAAEILGRVLGAYPGIAEYRRRAPEEAAACGHIDIRIGRRVLYDEHSPGTCAINYPIQGGAATVQMRALRKVWDRLAERDDDAIWLVGSIHDELILEAEDAATDEAKMLLIECMTEALLEVYPEAEQMGVASLSEASVVGSWAEKA